MKPHLIMPTGGAGSRFYEQGYNIPKPLVKIKGKPFFYWAAMSIARYIDLQDITFVVLKRHIQDNSIDSEITKYFEKAKIVVISEVLPGPVFTALEGVKNINDTLPLIFNDCDHMFKCSRLNGLFLKESMDADGVLLTFQSHMSQFSYVQYGIDGQITGTVEKKVVSDHAICGAYVFKNVEIFKDIANKYIRNCPYNECFMSGMYNVMCENAMRIKDFLLDYHVEFGTPDEYMKARESALFAEP